MAFRLFDAPVDEASRFVGFAGNRIDRQSENRSEESLPQALDDPHARIILSHGGRAIIRIDPHTEIGFSRLAATTLGARLDRAVLLGADETGPILIAPTEMETDNLPEGFKAIDHRSIYVQDLVGEAWLGALGQGAALLAWHAANRFCGRCGQPSEMRIGGYKRVCTGCGAETFPRTDPVAIMLAVTRDRCLLGRSPHFAPGMYSALAGFIEPGETIENAVRRETFEEAGIRLGRVVYQASQPWPFPHSLMIGCYGEALNEDIAFDGKELEDCRWFTRAETRAIIAGTHPSVGVPPRGAIATHLIKAWAESD